MATHCVLLYPDFAGSEDLTLEQAAELAAQPDSTLIADVSSLAGGGSGALLPDRGVTQDNVDSSTSTLAFAQDGVFAAFEYPTDATLLVQYTSDQKYVFQGDPRRLGTYREADYFAIEFMHLGVPDSFEVSGVKVWIVTPAPGPTELINVHSYACSVEGGQLKLQRVGNVTPRVRVVLDKVLAWQWVGVSIHSYPAPGGGLAYEYHPDPINGEDGAIGFNSSIAAVLTTTASQLSFQDPDPLARHGKVLKVGYWYDYFGDQRLIGIDATLAPAAVTDGVFTVSSIFEVNEGEPLPFLPEVVVWFEDENELPPVHAFWTALVGSEEVH